MTEEMGIGQSVWWALALTPVLALLHLAAPHLRKLPFVPERVTGSFAGGLAVAYVFLHLLPADTARGPSTGRAPRGVCGLSPGS